MAQLTVGLDLGSETIKRVRLRSSFRTVEVVDFVSEPVPVDERPRPARLAEALSKLQEESRPSDLVATALPGDEVSLRLITLPFSDRKRITQTISFELESQIPFPLTDMVYDYLQVGEAKDGGTRHLVALCQIERMQTWLQTLQEVGQDPRLVGSDNLAYTSLLEMLPPADGDTVAFLDVGHRLTSLCIIGPKGPEFARTLSSGGLDMTTQLAEAFKVERDEAEVGKRRSGFVESADNTAASPEQVMISDAIRRATTGLVRELRQSLSAHETLVKRRVGKIWLCGGGSTLDNFDRFMTGELNVEVERIRIDHINLPGMERLEGSQEASTTWVKALGLALHAHQGGRRGWLNLRRGPFAFQGDFEAMRGKVLHVGVAVLILVFLAIGYAVTSYLSLSATDRSVDKRIVEVTKTMLGKDSSHKDPDVIIAIIKEKVSPQADPLPRVTALDVLRIIHERVSEEIQLRLKDVNISPKKVRLSGATDSFDSVEKIKSGLEGYDCSTKVQTGTTQPTPDGKEVEFSFTIVFGC